MAPLRSCIWNRESSRSDRFSNAGRRVIRQVALRAPLLALAAAYLFEAWVWGLCVGLGRRLVALIPWDALKARIVAMLDALPAPFALLVFLIPVAIVEPLKAICIGLVVKGHLALGILGFIALKFIGFGLIAVVFDLTRHRLLTMAWFVRVYQRFLAFEAFAHRLIAPYGARVKAAAAALAAAARAAFLRLRASAS